MGAGAEAPEPRFTDRDHVVLSPRQAKFGIWTSYLLLDIVVLNLLVEFVPSIVIDSFWISIVTALLIRGLIDLTLRLERRIARVAVVRTGVARVMLHASRLLVLFASKFVILEVVDVVFGAHVKLGGFVEVIVIAVLLMATELALRQTFVWLGKPPASKSRHAPWVRSYGANDTPSRDV